MESASAIYTVDGATVRRSSYVDENNTSGITVYGADDNLPQALSASMVSGSFLNDPQTQYNYGTMYETDIRHQVKAYGWWEVPTDPWKQTLGASLFYYSGQIFERYYWSEESGDAPVPPS